MNFGDLRNKNKNGFAKSLVMEAIKLLNNDEERSRIAGIMASVVDGLALKG